MPAEGARPPLPPPASGGAAPSPTWPTTGGPGASCALPGLPPSPPATAPHDGGASCSAATPQEAASAQHHQQSGPDRWEEMAAQARATVEGDHADRAGAALEPSGLQGAVEPGSDGAPDFAACLPTHDACSFLVSAACEAWNTSKSRGAATANAQNRKRTALQVAFANLPRVLERAPKNWQGKCTKPVEWIDTFIRSVRTKPAPC